MQLMWGYKQMVPRLQIAVCCKFNCIKCVLEGGGLWTTSTVLQTSSWILAQTFDEAQVQVRAEDTVQRMSHWWLTLKGCQFRLHGPLTRRKISFSSSPRLLLLLFFGRGKKNTPRVLLFLQRGKKGIGQRVTPPHNTHTPQHWELMPLTLDGL